MIKVSDCLSPFAGNENLPEESDNVPLFLPASFTDAKAAGLPSFDELIFPLITFCAQRLLKGIKKSKKSEKLFLIKYCSDIFVEFIVYDPRFFRRK